MKGLLSSRLLNGPSGVKRLSKSLYRQTKVRKRSRRSVFVKRTAAAEREEYQEENSTEGSKEEEEEGGGGNNGAAVREEYQQESSTEGSKGKEEEGNNSAVVGEGYHEESSTEGSKEEEEEGDTGTEQDSSYVASGHIYRAWDVPPFDDNCNIHSEVIMVEDSLVNDANMQEEGVDANGKDFPKGPIVSSDWEAAMSSVAETPAAIAFICGGKNTGKSTFARCLVNYLLNRYGKVGFLDTDVGQPEFTPSGCLSLHVLHKPIVGLPALEMKDPERCYFFGDISPKSNPEDYLKSIFSLYDHFKNKYILTHLEGKVGVLKEGQFPLVVNTHGWIQGVGFEALIKIINHVMPTHIVQIISKTPSKNLPPNRFWELGTINPCNSQLLYINNAIGDSTDQAEIKFDARELRDLRLLSYFQKKLKDKLMPTSRLSVLFENAATALVCCKPFQVPISAIKVIHQHFQVPACESVYSLNAALVGLGVSDNKSQDIKPRCVGLGIVRAVDVSRGVFYVITPLKLEALQQVDTFLQGRMDIPVSLLKAPGYVSPYLCNNNISIEGTGSAVMGKGKKKALPLLRTSAIL